MEATDAKVYLDQTIVHAKTFVTQVFDKADIIDRQFYGKRLRWFVIGALLVVCIAPIIDIILKTRGDQFTYYSTLIYLLYLIVTTLALIGSWRDDSGNWTWERAKSKLQLYKEDVLLIIRNANAISKNEWLLKLGTFIFIGTICLKSLQNVSVFVRKPIEKLFNTRLELLRDFEHPISEYFGIGFVIAAAIFIYEYYKNPKVLEKLKDELFHFLGLSKSKGRYQGVSSVTINDDKLVINAKENDHVQGVRLNNSSVLFNDFISAINTWKPTNCNNEYQFQDRLISHLRRTLPDADIKSEYPLGSKEFHNRGRADIVINDTILIEMKKDSRASAVQRAKGQIHQYAEIWKGRGPVVLLLCDHDFDAAHGAYSPTMLDLKKLDRQAITIVATKPRHLN